jgi:hypothetical protein
MVVEDGDELPPLLADLVEQVDLTGLPRKIVQVDLAVFPHVGLGAQLRKAGHGENVSTRSEAALVSTVPWPPEARRQTAPCDRRRFPQGSLR